MESIGTKDETTANIERLLKSLPEEHDLILNFERFQQSNSNILNFKWRNVSLELVWKSSIWDFGGN